MFTDRLACIRLFLANTRHDAFLLTAREDIRWTCNFSGSSGALLIAADSATLFTDGRYAEQAPKEVRGATVEICKGDLVDAIGEHPAALRLSSVAVDGTHTTVKVFRQIRSWRGEPSLHAYDSPFADQVAVKAPEELQKMRQAQEISDRVFEEVLGLIRPGVAEHELAAEIVYRHLRHGAEAMSFDPIVASGENGALPHARPTDRRLAAGDLIVLDFGCFFQGYASDMTRTVGIGQPEADALRAYTVVRSAQLAAQEAARSEVRASDLDQIARRIINDSGLVGAFTHSLGHGLGLRIHEAPRIAATNSGLLAEGTVVTIEPGVYIPGRFGVRIENSVVLNKTGCHVLPRSSTELILL